MAIPGVGFDLSFRIGPGKAVLGFGLFQGSDPHFQDKVAEVQRLLAADFSLSISIKRWILFVALTRGSSVLSVHAPTAASESAQTAPGHKAESHSKSVPNPASDRVREANGRFSGQGGEHSSKFSRGLNIERAVPWNESRGAPGGSRPLDSQADPAPYIVEDREFKRTEMEEDILNGLPDLKTVIREQLKRG